MKLVSMLVLIFALVITVPALAVEEKIPNDNGRPGLRVDCNVDGCDYYGMDVDQEFDATGGPLTFGPVATAGGAIVSVVLSVEIYQTWVGDLNLHLYYDEDGDGIYDAGPVQALCRPALDGCPWDDCCGCSGNLAGVYTFGDDGAAALGEVDCPGDFTPGCFMPAIESLSFADVFTGMLGGGDFYIEIGDGAGGDATTLANWGVYICSDATATEEATWSSVKSVF